jgi:hypothetical protein
MCTYAAHKEYEIEALLPLLDAGALIYGSKGTHEIEKQLRRQWHTSDGVGVELLEETLELFQSGCVTYTIQYTESSGLKSQVEEEMSFSMNGLLQSMRVLSTIVECQ